jgi:endoglucanase
MTRRSGICVVLLVLVATVASPTRANNVLAGVNLSGAEFGTTIPGTLGTDYTWPTNQEIDYFASRGMNIVRVSFRWERMQLTLNGPLDATYLAALDGLVAHAALKGVKVLFDPHNSARYYEDIVGSDLPDSDFADFWSRMATHYVGKENVIFGLTNEPHDMPTEQWVDAANAAIVAIRAAGADQMIFVPGNGYTGAWTWSDNYYGTPNTTALLAIVDSGNNFAFEAHQYFDTDGSGSHTTCDAGVGAARLQVFTTWLRTHGYKGFLGELAGANNAGCLSDVTAALDHVKANNDVYLGWSWWAAGPWWGGYIFTLEPTSNFTVDALQMAWLQPYLPSIFASGFEH